MQSDVIAIIVTFNPSCKTLEAVLNALGSQSDVVIIDNGSSNSWEVKQLCEGVVGYRVYFKPMSQNLGLATAQNIGINWGIESGYRFGVLFDQDSIPAVNFISVQKRFYESVSETGRNVGAIGCVAHDRRSGEEYPVCTYSGMVMKRRYSPYQTSFNPAFLIASGCFFALEIVNVVGGMRDDFFIDYVDVEWSFRISSFGYELLVCNEAYLSHEIGDAFINILKRRVSVHGPLRRYYLTRNCMFMLGISHVPIFYKLREFLLLFLRYLVMVTVSKKRFLVTKFFFRGIFDGIRSQGGAFK
jgi:rhamnosyltransferase